MRKTYETAFKRIDVFSDDNVESVVESDVLPLDATYHVRVAVDRTMIRSANGDHVEISINGFRGQRNNVNDAVDDLSEQIKTHVHSLLCIRSEKDEK